MEIKSNVVPSLESLQRMESFAYEKTAYPPHLLVLYSLHFVCINFFVRFFFCAHFYFYFSFVLCAMYFDRFYRLSILVWAYDKYSPKFHLIFISHEHEYTEYSDGRFFLCVDVLRCSLFVSNVFFFLFLSSLFFFNFVLYGLDFFQAPSFFFVWN